MSYYMDRGEVYKSLAQQETDARKKAEYLGKAEEDAAMVKKLGGN
jgi:hypothetical protein